MLPWGGPPPRLGPHCPPCHPPALRGDAPRASTAHGGRGRGQSLGGEAGRRLWGWIGTNLVLYNRRSEEEADPPGGGVWHVDTAGPACPARTTRDVRLDQRRGSRGGGGVGKGPGQPVSTWWVRSLRKRTGPLPVHSGSPSPAVCAAPAPHAPAALPAGTTPAGVSWFPPDTKRPCVPRASQPRLLGLSRCPPAGGSPARSSDLQAPKELGLSCTPPLSSPPRGSFCL